MNLQAVGETDNNPLQYKQAKAIVKVAEGATETHTRGSLIKLEVSGKATQNKLHLSNEPNTCCLNIKWQCSNLSEYAPFFKHSPQQKSSLNPLHILTYSSLILFWVKLTVDMSMEYLVWERISFQKCVIWKYLHGYELVQRVKNGKCCMVTYINSIHALSMEGKGHFLCST